MHPAHQRFGGFGMKLLAWKPLRRGALRGFVDVELEVEHGRSLQISECAVLVGSNGPWIALPGKPQVDRDGTVRRKPGTDKPEYVALLRWGDRATGDAFSRAVVKLLLQRHPDVLAADEAA
jgi:hypothetical protein